MTKAIALLSEWRRGNRQREWTVESVWVNSITIHLRDGGGSISRTVDFVELDGAIFDVLASAVEGCIETLGQDCADALAATATTHMIV